MSKIVKIFMFVVLCFFVLNAGVKEHYWATGMFNSGNDYYEKGKYDSAIVAYEKICKNGIRNADVYYNLANSYFRNDNIGMAILNYEKAKLLKPDDEDINANLNFVKANIVDKVPEPPTGILYRFLKYINVVISLHIATITVSILFFLISICIIIWIISTRYNYRLVVTYFGIIFLIFELVFGSLLAFKINNYENVRHAIVIVSVIDVKNEPEGTQTLFSVHEGTKFKIRKRLNGWLLVSLPNGMAGWIPEQDVGLIEI